MSTRCKNWLRSRPGGIICALQVGDARKGQEKGKAHFRPSQRQKRLSQTIDLKRRMVGARGFEPPTSWSRTRRSSQAEPRPDGGELLSYHIALYAVPATR
jgi:hypothetical protein